jgi:hypothetical protein
MYKEAGETEQETRDRLWNNVEASREAAKRDPSKMNNDWVDEAWNAYAEFAGLGEGNENLSHVGN